jgi:hypothetical protein
MGRLRARCLSVARHPEEANRARTPGCSTFAIVGVAQRLYVPVSAPVAGALALIDSTLTC